MSLKTVEEALVGMVALWEHMFDEAHRCHCRDAQNGEQVVDGRVEKGELTKLGVTTTEWRAPTTCAYCAAKETLAHGRLAMDEQRIGRD